MRKRNLFLAVVTMGCLSTAGCGKQGQENGIAVIGEETVKQIVLEAAGVSEDVVRNLHMVRERDNGADVYEVEFYAENQEYDYEIDAYTGEIRSFDHDRERE